MKNSTEVHVTEENGEEIILLSNPIVVDEKSYFDDLKGAYITKFIPRKWLITSNDDLIILKRNTLLLSLKSTNLVNSSISKFPLQEYHPQSKGNESYDHSGFLGDIEEQERI